MPVTKQVRVVGREEVQTDDKPPRKPRANSNRDFSYRPFEEALRHITMRKPMKKKK